jgi:hypothetical protein
MRGERLLALSLLVLAAGEPAVAAPVFVGTSVRGELDADAARQLSERVAGALELGGIDDVSGQRDGDSFATTPTQLLDAVDEARRRYAAAEFERAIAGCDEALERFEDGPAYGPDESTWRALTDVLVLRALALSRVDRERDAKATVRRLLVLRPEFSADPAAVPPDFVELVTAMRRVVSRRQPGALEVTSAPPGAQVVVDGRDVGVTPLRLEELPLGRHYVAVAGEGDRHTRRVELAAEAVRVDARLGDPRRIAARVLVRALATGLEERQLVELSSAVAPDVVVAVAVPASDSTRVVLGRVRDGKLDAVAGAVLPAAEADAERRLRALAEAVSAGKSVGDAKQRGLLLQGEEESDSGLLLVGAGIAAGAALVVAGVVGAVLVVMGRLEAEQGFYVGVDTSRL